MIFNLTPVYRAVRSTFGQQVRMPSSIDMYEKWVDHIPTLQIILRWIGSEVYWMQVWVQDDEVFVTHSVDTLEGLADKLNIETTLLQRDPLFSTSLLEDPSLRGRGHNTDRSQEEQLEIFLRNF